MTTATETKAAIGAAIVGVIDLVASAVHPGFKEAAGPATAQAWSGALIVITALAGWFVHRLGTTKYANSAIGKDILAAWPTMRSSLPAAQQLPAMGARLDTVESALTGIPATVQAAVEAQLKSLFPQLFPAAPTTAAEAAPVAATGTEPPAATPAAPAATPAS